MHASALVQIHTPCSFSSLVSFTGSECAVTSYLKCRWFDPICASAHSSVVEHSEAARPYLRTVFSRISPIVFRRSGLIRRAIFGPAPFIKGGHHGQVQYSPVSFPQEFRA